MAARHPSASPGRAALGALVPALALLAAGALGACSSDNKVSTGGSSTIAVPTTFGLPTTTIAATTTSGAASDTTAAATTTAPPTTVAETTTSAPATTVASTDGVTTVAPPPTCPGPAALPANADTSHQITGNVDGDGVDDVVTAYTGDDGAAHVFLQRGSGGGNDVALPLGYSDTVSISFEDFDHSVGAVTPPPLVVMAIGAGQAGSAPVTFLSAVEGAGTVCLTQWQLDGQPFTFTIDQRGPFSGLLCDHAAGHTYYVLRTATPIDPSTTTTVATTIPPTTSTISGASTSTLRPVIVAFTTTATEIEHDGATVTLTELGGDNIPDDPTVKHKYGDILGCDHPPLFP